MGLRNDNGDDGYHWECPVNKCRKRRSIRARSFFEDYKIPLSHWLYIIFLWSFDKSNKGLQGICSLKILHGKIKLGGRGKTVEIDESMFGQ